jgi:hypothetical protein
MGKPLAILSEDEGRFRVLDGQERHEMQCEEASDWKGHAR